MADNNNILLKVENMSQYFKLGNSKLKAVDDVSFDIKKGEVFGLVGESGCGKTTTGRSIIKLYDITSGNIYFKGVRIAAGTLSYKQAIKDARKQLRAKIKGYKEACTNEINQTKSNNVQEIRNKYEELLKKDKNETKSFILEQKKQIKAAKYDRKKCDKLFIEKNLSDLKQKYDALFEKANEEERIKLEKEYEKEKREVKRNRLVTRIQMIFQDPIASLDPRMTVREIIAEGLIIKGIKDKKYIDEKVYKVLELVGLVREHAGRYPHEFSGGQRQRIGVARAIIMEPELIIADEPISALDVSIQAQVINLLNELRNRLGLTILFIAHDLSVVKYFSDRIGVMYFGKMVELASSEELFAHPYHPYTKSLLSAIPLPDPHYEKSRKRLIYNPKVEHDYSVDKPTMREVSPQHFVYCNDAEYEKIKKEIESQQ